MDGEKRPLELDGDVLSEETGKTGEEVKKPSYLRWSCIVSAFGVVLIARILVTGTENVQYIDSPPPEEQVERDFICSCAVTIEQYAKSHDSLPGQGDIMLQQGFAYVKEDELTWSIETEAGLYYSSDMDLEAFAGGEL